METRRAKSSSPYYLSNNPEKWRLQSICSGNNHLHLTYDRKKIQWTSNYELLQEFVDKNIKKPGKWTSPGGNSRRFTSLITDMCLTWYYSKQNTLLFQGKTGVNLRQLNTSQRV